MTREISFNWLLFWQYWQEPYLKPNQKSMVELFWKNSSQLLVVNFFRKKGPLQMFDYVSEMSLLPVIKKETNLFDFT